VIVYDRLSTIYDRLYIMIVYDHLSTNRTDMGANETIGEMKASLSLI